MRRFCFLVLSTVLALSLAIASAGAGQPPTREKNAAAQAPLPPERQPEAKVIPLEHAEAFIVCDLLRRTFPTTEGSPASLVVNADGRTNRIVLSGSQAMIERAIELTKALDVPASQDKTGRTVYTVPLKFANAKAAVGALREAMGQQFRGFRENEVLCCDERTNTLIVRTTPETWGQIRELVAKLDTAQQPPPSSAAKGRTRVQIVTYEVRPARDQIAALDMDKLNAAAGTCESLQKALSELGETRVLYRADETAELESGPKLVIGMKVPFVRGTQVTSNGAVSTQVEYEDVGWKVKLSGGWATETSSHGRAKINIEVESMSDSNIDLGTGVLAPVFHSVQQAFDGSIASGEPVLLLAVEATAPADKALAYVTRVVFHHEAMKLPDE